MANLIANIKVTKIVYALQGIQNSANLPDYEASNVLTLPPGRISEQIWQHKLQQHHKH